MPNIVSPTGGDESGTGVTQGSGRLKYLSELKLYLLQDRKNDLVFIAALSQEKKI
jgi:hypothetical protein